MSLCQKVYRRHYNLNKLLHVYMRSLLLIQQRSPIIVCLFHFWEQSRKYAKMSCFRFWVEKSKKSRREIPAYLSFLNSIILHRLCGQKINLKYRIDYVIHFGEDWCSVAF